MKKLVYLHPPLYPINHDFFNELGKHCELTVICFGEFPGVHPEWNAKNYIESSMNYCLKVYGTGIYKTRQQLDYGYALVIMKIRPDYIVSTAFSPMSIVGAVLSFFMRAKFIISTDATDFTEESVGKIKNLIRKWLAKRATRILCASPLSVTYVKRLESKAMIEMTPHIIDYDYWKASSIKKEKVSSTRVKLLGVGSLIEKKNWKLTIKAITKCPNVELLIVGEGPLEAELKELVESLNLSNRVNLVGSCEREKLLNYYGDSDALVFPSLYDQFGYVVPESLACGLPVLCSLNAGSSFLINEGVNGFCFNPESIEDIISSINSLSENLNLNTNHCVDSVNKLTHDNKVSEFKRTFSL